ncbi:hypothetical protein DID88_004390 [Monilinia fructigena]|uniref:Outer spore wall protein RRT8 n=1 Tax=Monilinia fructigena TaxID=38457 RepID=A0A395ITX8_9HELO|nr:hypothetical protein DID88_004390 [Monilinia fructigena]
MPTTIEKAGVKAKEVAKEDFDKAKELARSAAISGAYLYPIKGIFYFLSHRTLWKPLLSKLVPTLFLSAAVMILMFMFTFLPQLAILIFTDGPFAVVSAVLLTFSESSTIITMLSKNFIIADALIDTFDGVMVAKGQANVVQGGREIKSGKFGDPMRNLGKVVKGYGEKYSFGGFVRYLMYLPLNLIPVVGTVIFVGLQGRQRGEGVHSRYFQLKGWSGAQKEAWLKEHSGAYTSFGTVATLLELVPIASILFSFTNTVGAALWAADIEGNDTTMTQVSSPRAQKETQRAE